MRISELAARTGVPATALRFYGSAGLLPADRTPSGYRDYGDAAVARLAFIAAARHIGLPLAEVAELLAVRDSASCTDVRASLRPRVVARIAAARARSAELGAFAASLRNVVAQLDGLPDRAEPCDDRCTAATEIPADRNPVERWRTAPVACTLTPGDATGRAAQWRQLLAGGSRQRIPDGLRVCVPIERAADLAAVAAAEAQCCPFLDLRLHLDRRQVALEVRGTAAAAGFIEEMFGRRS